MQIHANVRIRRIYFSDRLYAEDEMPAEFKLYVPIASKKEKIKAKDAKVMEDKSTGKDIRTKSNAELSEEKILPADIVPSGALPSPTETPRLEEMPVEPENVFVVSIRYYNYLKKTNLGTASFYGYQFTTRRKRTRRNDA